MRITRRQLVVGGVAGLAGISGLAVVGRSAPTAYADGSGIQYSTAGAPFNYDGAKASAYADQYALTDVDGSVSGSLRWRGDDCTNFVSNCLYAGGMPMTPTWYSQQPPWWQWWGGWTYAQTWTVAPQLYGYLLGNGYGVELAVYYPGDALPAYNQLVPGDLVFFDWGQGEGISHVAIQTIPGNGMDLVDQHSVELFDQPWHLAPLNQNAPTTSIHLVHIVGNTAMDISY